MPYLRTYGADHLAATQSIRLRSIAALRSFDSHTNRAIHYRIIFPPAPLRAAHSQKTRRRNVRFAVASHSVAECHRRRTHAIGNRRIVFQFDKTVIFHVVRELWLRTSVQWDDIFYYLSKGIELNAFGLLAPRWWLSYTAGRSKSLELKSSTVKWVEIKESWMPIVGISCEFSSPLLRSPSFLKIEHIFGLVSVKSFFFSNRNGANPCCIAAKLLICTL